MLVLAKFDLFLAPTIKITATESAGALTEPSTFPLLHGRLKSKRKTLKAILLGPYIIHSICGIS